MAVSKLKESSITFQFDNPQAMRNFWTWLEEQGEQDYWVWMSDRENEEEGDITALEFNYEKADKGLVTTVCGRWEHGKVLR